MMANPLIQNQLMTNPQMMINPIETEPFDDQPNYATNDAMLWYQ